MKDEKVEILKQALKDTLWMAVRYSSGRHSYAPHIVRQTVNTLRRAFPEEKWLKKDVTIQPPTKDDLSSSPFAFRNDWLDDLMDEENG